MKRRNKNTSMQSPYNQARAGDLLPLVILCLYEKPLLYRNETGTWKKQKQTHLMQFIWDKRHKKKTTTKLKTSMLKGCLNYIPTNLMVG